MSYKWNRDTLLRIKSVYAANREAALNDRLQVLMQGDATQKAEAAEVRTQLKELATFCEKIDQLLASGYNPKLDDGVGKKDRKSTRLNSSHNGRSRMPSSA